VFGFRWRYYACIDADVYNITEWASCQVGDLPGLKSLWTTIVVFGSHFLVTSARTGWWRGVVGNTFRPKRSYSTPGPVSTAMGDCLQAGKPSWCEACQLGQLSLLPSVGW